MFNKDDKCAIESFIKHRNDTMFDNYIWACTERDGKIIMRYSDMDMDDVEYTIEQIYDYLIREGVEIDYV